MSFLKGDEAFDLRTNLEPQVTAIFDLKAITFMAVLELELAERRIGDLTVLSNPPVQINHWAKPDLGIYAEVPPWMTLERPATPYKDKISPEGWPPEYIQVIGQEWAYKCPNLWLLVQHLPDPYHMKYSHLGEYNPHGWSGEETRTVRAFEIEKNLHGQENISFHWFIRDRRQLLSVYKGIPERVVANLFLSPRR